MRPIDEAFLENYFTKKLGINKGDETNVLMAATSAYARIKVGPQFYETLEDLCELDSDRHTHRGLSGSKLSFRQGINENIIHEVAPERY